MSDPIEIVPAMREAFAKLAVAQSDQVAELRVRLAGRSAMFRVAGRRLASAPWRPCGI